MSENQERAFYTEKLKRDSERQRDETLLGDMASHLNQANPFDIEGDPFRRLAHWLISRVNPLPKDRFEKINFGER